MPKKTRRATKKAPVGDSPASKEPEVEDSGVLEVPNDSEDPTPVPKERTLDGFYPKRPVSKSKQPILTSSQPLPTSSQEISTSSQPLPTSKQSLPTSSQEISTSSQPISTPLQTRSKTATGT
jgi:hypothetical protein